MVLNGEGTRLYDLPRYFEVQQQLYGKTVDSMIYLNPPFFALLWVPFALLPYRLARLVWFVLSVVMAWLGLRVMCRTLGRVWNPWLMALLVSTPPVLFLLMTGQNGMLSVFIWALGIHLLLRDRDWSAGFVLSLALFKPQFAVLIPVMVAVLRKTTALKAWFSGAIVLYAVSAMVSGILWPLDYLNLLNSEAYVGSHAVFLTRMVSFLGQLRRVLGIKPLPLALLSWAVAAVIVVVASKRLRLRGLSALTMTLTLFTSPHAFEYDLVLLTWPCLVFWWSARKNKSAASPIQGQ
jgi:hypothetical protein